MNPRSYLFVPATSGHKVGKAYAGAADAIIIDLEDAVAVSEKPAARAALATLVPAAPAKPTWIRINAAGTAFCFADLQACCRPGVAGLLLPKVESAEQLRMADWILANVEREQALRAGSVALAGIVETALGLQHVAAIAAATPRLQRLMFGAVDLAADLGIDTGDDVGATGQARFAIACASRAAGIEAPVDTAYIDIANLDGLRATTLRARALGYAAKACIHPNQVPVVNEVFTPTAADVERARRIVAAFDEAERAGAAALQLDGQMLDYPVVEQARRLLARAA